MNRRSNRGQQGSLHRLSHAVAALGKSRCRPPAVPHWPATHVQMIETELIGEGSRGRRPPKDIANSCWICARRRDRIVTRSLFYLFIHYSHASYTYLQRSRRELSISRPPPAPTSIGLLARYPLQAPLCPPPRPVRKVIGRTKRTTEGRQRKDKRKVTCLRDSFLLCCRAQEEGVERNRGCSPPLGLLTPLLFPFSPPPRGFPL